MNFVGSCTVLYGEEEAKVEEGDVMIILIGADDLEYFFLAHANICSFLLHPSHKQQFQRLAFEISEINRVHESI